MVSATSNLDAERATIGAIVLDARALTIVAPLVTAEDFEDHDCRNLYTTIANDNGKYDLLTLAETAGVSAQVAADMANGIPTWECAGGYAKIVAEKAATRRLLLALGAIIASADGTSPTELLDRAQREINAIAIRRAIPEVSTEEKIRSVLDAIEKRADGNGQTGVDTGIYALDRILGGLHPGALTVVAARPSLGKTALAMQLASRAALRGHPVLFVSAEDSEDRLLVRALSQNATVPYGHLQITGHSEDLGAADWQGVLKTASALSGATFSITDAPRSQAEVIAACRAWRSRLAQPVAKCGLIAVDYLQRIEPGRIDKSENREAAVARMARGYKDLARELDLPVLLAAQLNRSSEYEDRKPTLSDLRESGAIEQEADAVVMIHRKRLEMAGEATLIVAKNRHGLVGEASVRWCGKYQRFEQQAIATMQPWGDDDDNNQS